MLGLFLMAAAFLAAHGAAAAVGGAVWGLHFARYLDAPALALALAAGVAATWALLRPPSRPSWLPPAFDAPAAALLSLPVFWAARDRLHFLGDGSVFSEFRPEWSAWANREPFAHAIAHRLNDAAAATGVPFERVFEAWSCVLGAGLVAVLARADRELGARGLLFGFAATTGAMQLFFGYVEHYPPVAFVAVGLLLELRRVFAGPRPIAPALALLALAILLHVQSILLAPATLWAILHQVRRRGTRGRAQAAAEVAGVAAITAAAWEAALGGIAGAPSLGGYLAILAQSNRFVLGSSFDASSVRPPLFSARHLLDFLNLQLLLVPIALPAAAIGAVRTGWRRILENPWDAALLGTAAAYVGAQFVFDPYLGAPRDWDVLATGAFPMAFFAARVCGRLASPRTTAFAVGLAAAHTLAFVLVNASARAATARFEELPLTAGQVDFVLGTRALKAGDLQEAARRFEEVVRIAPYSTPGWFSLGLARERQRDFEAAREAFARALAARTVDERVPAADIFERIARAAIETGRFDEARRALELATRERPETEVGRALREALEQRQAGAPREGR